MTGVSSRMLIFILSHLMQCHNNSYPPAKVKSLHLKNWFQRIYWQGNLRFELTRSGMDAIPIIFCSTVQSLQSSDAKITTMIEGYEEQTEFCWPNGIATLTAMGWSEKIIRDSCCHSAPANSNDAIVVLQRNWIEFAANLAQPLCLSSFARVGTLTTRFYGRTRGEP